VKNIRRIGIMLTQCKGWWHEDCIPWRTQKKRFLVAGHATTYQ
jgi:hypothetical protein